MLDSSSSNPNGNAGVPDRRVTGWMPAVAFLIGAVSLLFWLLQGPHVPLSRRVPGTDKAPAREGGGSSNAVLAGKVTTGQGLASHLPGLWPGFRGPNRMGFTVDTEPHPMPTKLARVWEPSGPRELWGIDVGEGYAGPAVLNGRVYLADYDREKKQDAIRCLSLDDGKEIWRYAYPVSVKRNHGMSRTVPAVTDKYVVTMGPKCHVACLSAASGELRWGLDLVRQFGATVPDWYAGQCPFVETNGVVVLAPGGKDALLMAVDCESGKVLWTTPNPNGWKMTHSSIMPMEWGEERIYVYCASRGVVGVSAKDGHVLWESTDWKISIATVPSPLILENGQIFFSGGYNAGSLMLHLQAQDGRLVPKTLFKLDPETFGATQQTPVFYDHHIYGVRPDGQFVCLNLDGKVAWSSGPTQTFGLGSFLFADGLIFALNDSGLLRLIEATPEKYHRLAQAQVLNGHDSWGPMALVGTRLIARDLTRMVCLEVGGN